MINNFNIISGNPISTKILKIIDLDIFNDTIQLKRYYCLNFLQIVQYNHNKEVNIYSTSYSLILINI